MGEVQDAAAVRPLLDGEPFAAVAIAVQVVVANKHDVRRVRPALCVNGQRQMRAAPEREETCRSLEHLGIRIDRERNARHDPIISAPGSACTVRTVRTDEDLMIARHTRALLARSAA